MRLSKLSRASSLCFIVAAALSACSEADDTSGTEVGVTGTGSMTGAPTVSNTGTASNTGTPSNTATASNTGTPSSTATATNTGAPSNTATGGSGGGAGLGGSGGAPGGSGGAPGGSGGAPGGSGGVPGGSGGVPGGGAGGGDVGAGGAGGAPSAEAYDFAGVQEFMLYWNCRGCHEGEDASTPHYPRDGAELYELFMTYFVADCGAAGETLVVPGDPDNSALVSVLEGKCDPEIPKMPPMEFGPTPAEVAGVRGWVANGALQ